MALAERQKRQTVDNTTNAKYDAYVAQYGKENLVMMTLSDGTELLMRKPESLPNLGQVARRALILNKEDGYSCGEFILKSCHLDGLDMENQNDLKYVSAAVSAKELLQFLTANFTPL